MGGKQELEPSTRSLRSSLPGRSLGLCPMQLGQGGSLGLGAQHPLGATGGSDAAAMGWGISVTCLGRGCVPTAVSRSSQSAPIPALPPHGIPGKLLFLLLLLSVFLLVIGFIVVVQMGIFVWLVWVFFLN